MAKSNERIPVTEQRLKALNELKTEGQTYDALLQELIEGYERSELAERASEVREADSMDLTSLDDL